MTRSLSGSLSHKAHSRTRITRGLPGKGQIGRIAVSAAAIGFTSGFAALAWAETDTPVRYDRHLLVELETRNEAELNRVLGLADVVLTHDVEVGPIEILIRPERADSLAGIGVGHLVKPHNIQAEIDAERERIQRYEATTDVQALAREAPAQDTWGDWFKEFQSTTAVDAYLDTLAALDPQRARVEVVGKSLEDRPIRALRIAGQEGRPAMLINGTHHAREWYSPSTVACIADALVRRYNTNPEVKNVVDGLEIFIVFMLNPDGYEYTRGKDRMWRKNRRESYGVDLNRNWSVGWAASSDKNSETYPGPSAFSEPETTALRDFIDKHPQLKMYIDYHTPDQKVYYPDDKIKDWAQLISDKMSGVGTTKFPPGKLGAGGLGMAYGHSKTNLGMLVELRRGPQNGGFGGPPEDIIPICKEGWAGFLAATTKLAGTVPPPPPPDGGTPDTGPPDGNPDTGAGGGGGGRDSGTGGSIDSGVDAATGGMTGTGGMSGGSGGTGGVGPSGGTGGNGMGGSSGQSGGPGTGGRVSKPDPDPGNGCGCRLPGREQDRLPFLWLATLGASLAAIRKRRRRPGPTRSNFAR